MKTSIKIILGMLLIGFVGLFLTRKTKKTNNINNPHLITDSWCRIKN